MKITSLRDSLCQRWGDLWMLLFREKRIRCLVSLAHNGSGVSGAKRPYLASTKVFRNNLRLWAFMSCPGCKI